MNFSQLLASFSKLTALVVGDLMLDEYIFGSATRISQEAPVMVVKQQRATHVPGGAANVARNLRALGAQTRVAGLVGVDEAGDRLISCFTDEGFDSSGIVRAPNRITTRKTRVLADAAHQVLRIDHEDESPADDLAAGALRDAALRLLSGVDLVLLSDYRKGALARLVVRSIMERAVVHGIPVVVNAKPRTLELYRGATLVSLNRSEATEALGLAAPLDGAMAGQFAEQLRQEFQFGALLLTLGEAGMAVAGADAFRVDAPKVEVYDTAGAGDTVIATVALGLASAGLRREVFELAAETSASVVRKVGVATPSALDLAAIASKS